MINSSQDAFRIELQEQERTTVYRLNDPFSMGRMRIIIGGVEVWNDDTQLTSSAISLLRTVASDFDGPLDGKVHLHKLAHHCGLLPEMGCPIGASWSVVHRDEAVYLDRIMRAEVIGHDEFVAGISQPVIVDQSHYAREILSFAAAVRDGVVNDKERFVGAPGVLTDLADLFEKFWKEYDELLFGHR
jgi:hypothetical protein